MRSAARQFDDDEEPPPGEDPRVRAAALDARFERVLLGLEAGRRDQDLMVELIATGRRYAENTAATERLLAAQFSEERTFAAGVAAGEARAAARQAVPRARHAARQQPPLMRVLTSSRS